MAKQTKSTQESAKPKKPLVNWFSRTKEKSSVKDSITPSGDIISYSKKKVTAPASVLGGGKMSKEVKKVENFKKDEKSDFLDHLSNLSFRKKEKEGQKSKSKYSADIRKVYQSPKDSSVSHYEVLKSESKNFRKPTKLLSGVDKMSKDSSLQKSVTKFDSPKLEGIYDSYDMGRPSGKREFSKKVLSMPKSTAKSMKESFDNMKSAPEYVVKKNKKGSKKY